MRRRYKAARDIKVGLVGYGASYNMGPLHINEMRQAGMSPVAVVSRTAERREAARRDFPGIQTFASLEELLEKSAVELVVIATPHDTHAKLVVQALKAGRHVVCEKPMAITTAECDAMIAAARKSDVLLSVYHNRHWDPPIVNAVAHLRKGVIGKIVRIEAHVGGYDRPANNWYARKSTCGGIAYSWGPHLLEYSFQLMNSKMIEVTGFSKNGHWATNAGIGRDCNEDETFTTVRFANGAWLSLLVTSIDSNPRRGILDITGTKGSYVMDWGSNELIQHLNGRTVSTKYRNTSGPHWSQGRRYYENLSAHFTQGAKLAITAEWARRTIHVLDLSDRSARLGHSLKTKYG